MIVITSTKKVMLSLMFVCLLALLYKATQMIERWYMGQEETIE